MPAVPDSRTDSIHEAIREKNYDEVRRWLASDETDVNARNKEGCTPLWIALEGARSTGNLRLIKLFCGDLRVKINELFRWSYQEKESSVFHYFIEHSDIFEAQDQVEILRILLTRQDIDVNLEDSLGATSLVYAVERFDVFPETEMILDALLNDERVDVNVKDSRYGMKEPLIHLAQYHGRGTAVLKKFLAHPKIDVNAKGQQDMTLFAKVLSEDTLDLAELLIRDPRVDIDGSLHRVVRKLELHSLFEPLMAREDLNVNAIDDIGRTAFSIALRQEDARGLTVSLAKDPRLDVVKTRLDPIIHLCAVHAVFSKPEYIEVAEAILDRPDVDVNAEYPHGPADDPLFRTMFEMARIHDIIPGVALLIKKGANWRTPNGAIQYVFVRLLTPRAPANATGSAAAVVGQVEGRGAPVRAAIVESIHRSADHRFQLKGFADQYSRGFMVRNNPARLQLMRELLATDPAVAGVPDGGVIQLNLNPPTAGAP